MERNQRLLNRYALDEEDTIYVLELSYGKDSLACLGAIEKLGLPLHRIVHKEVWATQTIPADLPPMVEFKAKADEIIYQRYGIKVEHICATKNGGGTILRRRILLCLAKRKVCRGIQRIPSQ